nr:cleavage stimulating factor 64 [Ipomoea batatas]
MSAANSVGKSKKELYDIMCEMKKLMEQNEEQARQILIENPTLARDLFKAQIMLGMVQPTQPSPSQILYSRRCLAAFAFALIGYPRAMSAANIVGKSKKELYDIMCEMKKLMEQNEEQARDLFHAQIMLGMVQPTQPTPSHVNQSAPAGPNEKAAP